MATEGDREQSTVRETREREREVGSFANQTIHLREY